MRLLELQDRLRSHIRTRIGRRELTGSGLSQQAGFQQGHLSNFLNARRGLSLESMDRLLETLELEILDLVDAGEIQRRALLPEPDGLESIAVVAAQDAALLPRFSPQQIDGTVSFRKTFLHRLRAKDVCDRSDWLRFVTIKLNSRTVQAAFPRSAASAMLLVDRHYTSLDVYRQSHPNLYVMRLGGRCAVGYLSLAGDCLVLRPRNPQLPVEVVHLGRAHSYCDYVVGRVCHVALEV